MPTLQHLPAWKIEYDYTLTNAILRDQNPGYTRQARKSHRQIMIANAQRFLRGAQLPYWEHFILNVCREGSLKFTDYYADGNGVQQGLIRVVNGRYSVQTDTRNHIVSCQIEVFR